MYAAAPFMTALYNDVKDRLPLWNTEYADLAGTTVRAVTSTWVSPEKKKDAKVFLGVEANTRAVITPEVVAQWVQHVARFYSQQVTGEFLCYLCFIDAAGSVSYYACETATVDS
ncbi:hypothetical protein ABB37_04562 [Leptomonas pyrrhocoris]|uniref:Uncharacterized protein n=1 Tax=Leptomonas pyrrhocoris TaxID=157538 RepID=A0A0M9G1E0_LEPPY|nr:hypothetical protein ABB37_04562 [Leptomonas pyrrhocoris]KPA80263.1 hypothetical protein ABB37_04562 [Leptomonas pyrrhocoris]|eukprot:XP_015658702.1 hypothetical protein ABB37_04562 [Leptomonas pyrrhocoris]